MFYTALNMYLVLNIQDVTLIEYDKIYYKPTSKNIKQFKHNKITI